MEVVAVAPNAMRVSGKSLKKKNLGCKFLLVKNLRMQ
jgi:hypothetical protein